MSRRLKPDEFDAASAHEHERVLQDLGFQVRRRRTAAGLTLKQVAERSGLSERFLGMVEGARGNPAVTRLHDLACALGCNMTDLLQPVIALPGRPVVALLGLRGAGKTSVGTLLARRMHVPFVEVDALVEQRASMNLGEIFSTHGEAHYRRLELQVLREVLLKGESCVLATGGGVVTHAEAMELLSHHARTVWLKAPAQVHWERVVAQGDRRPMAGNPRARAELEDIYAQRAPLYARADITVDTTRTEGLSDCAEQVLTALGR